MRKIGLLVAISIILTMLLVGCSKAETKKDDGLVTLQEFNQLDNKMSFEAVIDLLGPPAAHGDETQKGKEVEYSEDESYVWNGVSPDSFIALTFKNDMLRTKMQKGLE